MASKLNRIKTALVDNGKTNKWLAEQLGNGEQMVYKCLSAIIRDTHADSKAAECAGG